MADPLLRLHETTAGWNETTPDASRPCLSPSPQAAPRPACLLPAAVLALGAGLVVRALFSLIH